MGRPPIAGPVLLPEGEEGSRTASGLAGVTMGDTLGTCGTCQFWYATKESGECHRYPPQVVLNGATPVAQPHTYFPVLPPNAVGCGEHWVDALPLDSES